MEITELTAAERRVWDAFPRGATVDFRTGDEAADDPEAADGWGTERTVRGEVLRALLVLSPQEDGEVAALRVIGARITGVLNLRFAAVPCAVTLSGCRFEQAPHLYGAQMRQLNLSDSVLPGLSAATLRVDGVLRITGCRIPGPVQLGGSKITQALFGDRARIGVNADGSTAFNQKPVLQLNHTVIEDDLWLPGLVVHGEFGLNGATVSGQVRLDDAELTHPGGTALQAETLTAGSDLHAMRIRIQGTANVRGMHIPGQLNLSYARLSNPGGTALRASSCTIGEFWLRAAAPVQGSVNLRRTQIDLIHAEPAVWPRDVRLDGLSYTALLPSLPAAQRLPLLERERDGYTPYAYEQLTSSYRRIGDDGAARTVLLAKQRRHRGTLPRYARLWGYLQDATVGYGYRPVRAAAWLLSLLLLGTLAYSLHAPVPLKADEHPPFNALFYTLDLLLPLVDFGQEKAFDPQGWYQWLSYGLIVLGWLLATTIAAGITRSVSRQ
ncbi:membrane-associated oxidoreductase [Streptomyces sp. NPDC050421]|uniref:membrane-associated oxidoreductase n=1 Tax=unclassified Streptomyces TaxID=2593676 RepID=UPI0037A5F845